MDRKAADQMKMLQRGEYGFPGDKILYDAAGLPFKLGLWDGKPTPPLGQKFLSQVESYPLRDDDVILCGYPKTGCHWTWEVLNMILTRNAQVSTMGKTVGFLEMAPLELIDKLSSPRVLNTHYWYDNLPGQIGEKKTKLILTVRNPKDVAVSYYHHHINLPDIYDYKGTFENWFEFFMEGEMGYGSYFDYYADWEDAIKRHPEQPIMVVRLEDMKEDLPREIRKMSKFLGVKLEDQLVQDIAKAAGFDSMKKKFSEVATVSKHLLRKGQVGDWQNWLTAEQCERIEKGMEKLKGSRFITRYTI